MAEAGNGSGNEPRDADRVPDDAEVEVEVVEGELDAGELDGEDVSFVEIDDGEVEVVDTEAPVEPPLEQQLRQRVAELEQENKALYERMLRVAADAENLKRRTEREKDEIRRYGTEKVMTDMIPVLDNLERALTHGRSSQDRDSLLQGVEMVQRQFEQALTRFGCKAFDSVGLPFDPLRHEAVQQVESAEHPSNTVVEEYQKGYFLQDRLVRPALVVVSRLPAGMEAPRPASGAEDSPIAVDTEGEAYAPGAEESEAAEGGGATPDGGSETVH